MNRDDLVAPDSMYHNICIASVSVILFPLILPRSMKFLGFSSIVGNIAIFGLLVFSTVAVGVDFHSHKAHTTFRLFMKEGKTFSDAIKSSLVILFSFMNISAIPDIYTDLKKKEYGMKVVITANGLIGLIYLWMIVAVGIFFSYAVDKLEDGTFYVDAFDKEHGGLIYIAIACICESIACALSTPIFFFILREQLWELIARCCSKSDDTPTCFHYGSTLIWFSTLLICLFCKDAKMLMEFLGGFNGGFFMFVIPSTLQMHADGGILFHMSFFLYKGEDEERVEISFKKIAKMVALNLVFLTGVFLCGIAVVQIIQDIVSMTKA